VTSERQRCLYVSFIGRSKRTSQMRVTCCFTLIFGAIAVTVKCRTAIKATFLYFNLCPSVKLMNNVFHVHLHWYHFLTNTTGAWRFINNIDPRCRVQKGSRPIYIQYLAILKFPKWLPSFVQKSIPHIWWSLPFEGVK
jgi:hypothetical protein